MFARKLSTRVFICYRRDGAGAGYALDLRNRLAAVLGARSVFLDVAGNAIDVGDDWRHKVREAIGQSSVVVVLIDSRWSERLANDDDAVRFELDVALGGTVQGRQIFPVLVGDARMPFANELPVSLANLTHLSASHIRSGTADVDVAAIVRHLTGRASPGPAPRPDGYDALIIVGTFTAAGAVWLSFLRHQLNTNEKWLWGTAVVVLAFGVCASRRLLAAWQLGPSTPVWRQAGILMAIGALGASACYLGYRLVYRVPQFSEAGVGGFLLARFSGDPQDHVRATFANRFATTISNEGIIRYLGVPADNLHGRRMERLLGLVSDPVNPLILLLPHRVRDDADAKAYAVSSRASMVLWGSLGQSGELEMSVSFAPESENVYELPNGVVGLTDIHEIPGNRVESVEVETFQRALAWLLAGYRKYHADPPDYANAEASFSKGLAVLGSQKDSGLIGALKATLNLSAGNALLFRGQLSDAAMKYDVALRLSTIGTTPMFIEAANNMAYVERARGNSYLGRTGGSTSNARKILETVIPACDPAALTPSKGCAYVWYNLGTTYHDEAYVEDVDAEARKLYVRAGEYFEKSVELLKGCQGGGFEQSRCELLPEAIQNLAYGLAKQAELTTNPTADELAAVSRKTDEAITVSRRLEIELPRYYGLTAARIRLMRREWRQAIDDLTALKDVQTGDRPWPPSSRAELHLLLAAAQKCAGLDEQAEVSLETYKRLAGSLPNPILAQFREIQEIPRLTRPCTNRSGAQRGGVSWHSSVVSFHRVQR